MVIKSPPLYSYLVTLTVNEESDLLRRIAILNAALYRIVATPAIKLIRVKEACYQEGRLILLVEAPEADPSVVPGTVTAQFERSD